MIDAKECKSLSKKYIEKTKMKDYVKRFILQKIKWAAMLGKTSVYIRRRIIFRLTWEDLFDISDYLEPLGFRVQRYPSNRCVEVSW